MKAPRTADQVKFGLGSIVVLVSLAVLAGAAALASQQPVQDRTASMLVVVALLIGLIFASGKALQAVNRRVDARFLEGRKGNESWARGIKARYDVGAELPPQRILALTFAEDRRVLVPIVASETVRGEWRGRPFVAAHVSGYEKLVTGSSAKGRDASTNLVYLTLASDLPELRIVARSRRKDYGRPMSRLPLDDPSFTRRWRVETDDLAAASEILNPRIRGLLTAWDGPSVSLAATGPYLIAYGDPIGDADAIIAQLKLLSDLADRARL
ncbi:MAG: hypothetical protein ACOH19_14920 [Rhodoglobus sp.]